MWFAIIIIMIIVCLSLVIFAPKENVFFNVRDFPELRILSNEMNTQHLLRDAETMCENYVDYPDRAMWKFNEHSTFKIFPFYIFDTLIDANVSKCPLTFATLQAVPHIKTASFVRIEGKSVLKVHQGWGELVNDTYRCLLGLNIPANDIQACGVWVCGITKKLEDNKWTIFDASKKHSIYNKQPGPCIMLMIDIPRHDRTKGRSTNMPNAGEVEKFLSLCK